jgi:phosphate transport system permease protein
MEASMPDPLSRNPTAFEVYTDRGFRALTRVVAWLVVLLIVVVVIRIGATAWPAVQKYGAGFVVRTTWDPTRDNFGIGPQIAGTLYSAFLGLVLGTLFGLAVAIVLSQDFLPPKWEWVVRNVVQLLAAIPSVVFGLWGLFVVIPLLRPIANWVHDVLGWIPSFSTRLSGPGLLPTALVLAIMILPTISAISRDAMVAVPNRLREAAFGMGATRWQTILLVVLPTAAPGIFGAIILGFGRAVGETMAVAMLIGNAEVFNWSLFSPGTTLAALLANHFAEANQVEIGALMYAALVLLAITLVINIIGEFMLNRASEALGGLQK